MTRPGIFYGVGVGPGDPDLITRRAERVLRSADWLFFPAGGPEGSSFVRRIIEPLGLPEAKFRPVRLAMSRDRDEDLAAYCAAAEEIMAVLRRGESAAWITEGDPSLYSTFLHVRALVCRDPSVRIEVVPGVTSASAAAARVGWPLASLDEQVAIVPAAYGVAQLPDLLEQFAAVVLLKVHRHVDELRAALAHAPAGTRAAYAERLGTPDERVVTDLEQLRGERLPYFSLVIVRREKSA